MLIYDRDGNLLYRMVGENVLISSRGVGLQSMKGRRKWKLASRVGHAHQRSHHPGPQPPTTICIINPLLLSLIPQILSRRFDATLVIRVLMGDFERNLIAVPLYLLARRLIRLSLTDKREKQVLEWDVVTRDYPFYPPALLDGPDRGEESLHRAALRVSIVQMELTRRALRAQQKQRLRIQQVGDTSNPAWTPHVAERSS